MPRFLDNGDSTVTDTNTGLIWSKNTVASDVTYADAEKVVAEMGDGWRLPTLDELQTIVDRSKHSPAIDAEAFPDTENDWYWTADKCAWNDKARWVVYFYFGNVHGLRMAYHACVRAVRASQ